MRRITFLLTLSLCALFTFSQNTAIPDSNFEQALIDLGYDTILDGQVLTANISNVIELNIENKNIADLKGIQDFTLLRRLYCQGNALTFLPINTNTELRTVNCNNNLIISLNISNLSLLKKFFCNNNNLSSINISNNVNLRNFQCRNNNISTLTLGMNTDLKFINAKNNTISSLDLANLTSLKTLNINNNAVNNLDLSNNTNLKKLFVNENNLSDLDVSTNIDLIYLYANKNNISSISISNNQALERLFINENNLSSLDTSTNTALEWLYFNYNSVTNINLSNNINLNRLFCRNNSLTSLNVQNGNNINIANNRFKIQNNPNLNCVLVDDAIYSTSNWTNKDSQTSYNDVGCDIYLSAKVYLQGAALNPNVGEENLMRDDLRAQGMLPNITPYTDGKTCNSNIFNITGPDAIVDWVWVELRDKNDSFSVLQNTSALLQRDGDIVNTDGVSALSFNTTSDDYYISIKHRNHLGVISNNTIFLSENNTNLNFTDANNQITNGIDAQSNYGMPNGIVAMWAGNANNDTSVRYLGSGNDTNAIKDQILAEIGNSTNSNLYSFSGYASGDINLDGVTKYLGSGNDTNILKDIVLAHLNNQTSPSNLYLIQEQLP
ncbi:hypothetical protein [Pseudofulvibacter geojedonensis]|uniref:Uncharacterized protein n=1 Tax=Pseudofulvibacter geojedonensis TaxID=1123758 RepID=A0ABW3I4F6_9FLAO